MKIFKHGMGWSSWGISVQRDLCYEPLGFWWPDWCIAIRFGLSLFVIAKCENEM